MPPKKKAPKLPVYDLSTGKLKKTRRKIAVDVFTPIGRAAEEAREHADDKAEATELKRRYEPRRRAH